MVQQASKNLKIVNEHNKISLEYLYKINKKQVKRKTKNGTTLNKFYLGYMPPELLEYFNFKDGTLFFYEKKGQIRISSVMPSVEYQSIKVQKNNTYSIPRDFFPTDLEHFTSIRLTVDFNTPDDYMNGGTLLIELI